MALSIYSLLMLFLITTRWKWNLGCLGAAFRTDSMRWKRISGNITEASFCFNFQGHTGLQFPGVRRNCNWRKAHWKHTGSVSFQSCTANVTQRHCCYASQSQTLLLKATLWQSKTLSSQAFWILNAPWAQTEARAVAPWHACYSLDPQLLSFCPSVCPINSVSRSLKAPFQLLFLWLAHGLAGRSRAEGEHGDFTLHWVLFWLCFGVASFLFLSWCPTSPAGRCTWLGRGTDIR